MSKNTSISLGDHFAKFIEAQLAQGRYGSTSDVVRAGLRLLEDQETKLAALRAALIEGENSGPSKLLDMDAFIANKRAQKAKAP
jgi:antitoxin ParD1/3/4